MLKSIGQDKLALCGFLLVLVLIFVGALAPWLAPHDPIHIDLKLSLHPPDQDYPFGTDHLGRCILSRLIYGVRLSLGLAVLVVTVIFGAGLLVGASAGYLGGSWDHVLMRIVDILLAFPGLILAIGIAGFLGPSLINIMMALSLVNWVGYARIARGLVLSLKEKEFVVAARASGSSPGKIMRKHILPNMISPLIVLATLDMGAVILQISGMSFLGLGAQPPTPEWGAMLSEGRSYMQLAPWVMVYPGGAILLTVMAFNLLGDGLRDALDPRFGNDIWKEKVM
ncbi:nickel ABC transporter permease subunit NikC [Candidatus Formimonas warabiya]|uniref:Nickel ABC transporter permease subunit NikC n=1 Tax=Formimonas warabiya TaxID=1761012 RepID=A0A3G1KYS4_FORW1|nr:nickel ABC transporter permease subunit NikC [Candidatus Formimonas warabiya]